MTDRPMSKRWPVRITRAFLVLTFVYNLACGIFDLTAGHLYGLICIALLPAIAGTLAWQVRYLRRADARNRPRPDYSLIASMELPIWGRTFEHAGAPGHPRETADVPKKYRKGYAGITAEVRRLQRAAVAGEMGLRMKPCPRGHTDWLWVEERGPVCCDCDSRHATTETTTED